MSKGLVERMNALTGEEVFARYCPRGRLADLEKSITLAGPHTVGVECRAASGLETSHLQSCLDLIEQTSAHDYQASETGWSPAKKRREMKLPDMRYILLCANDSKDGNVKNAVVVGFVSFMVTYEDGHEVVYIYEIHLKPEFQGKGIGQQLVRLVESFAANVGVEKVMLTVFKSNTRAHTWYEKLGYSIDEFSPPARRLRNGVVKEPTYTILSRDCKTS